MIEHQALSERTIAVIGLGYVGLPLAVEFGKKFMVVGYDINQTRIQELRDGLDTTREVTSDEIKAAKGFRCTGNLGDIQDCKVYIVTVPTPIDEYKKPNLTPLYKASESVGRVWRGWG